MLLRKVRSGLLAVVLLLLVTALKPPAATLKIKLRKAGTGEAMPFVAMWIVGTQMGSVADSVGAYTIPIDLLELDTVCLMFRFWTSEDTTVCFPKPETDTTVIINYPDKSGRKNGSGWR